MVKDCNIRKEYISYVKYKFYTLITTWNFNDNLIKKIYKNEIILKVTKEIIQI